MSEAIPEGVPQKESFIKKIWGRLTGKEKAVTASSEPAPKPPKIGPVEAGIEGQLDEQELEEEARGYREREEAKTGLQKPGAE